MQKRKECMEPPEMVMYGRRPQACLEVGEVGTEEPGIDLAEIPLFEPGLETPKDVPVDEECLMRPAFHPGREFECLPALGEG